MKSCFITFRSVTPAQRAEAVLRKAGFSCSLQRTPRRMEEKGCGYSLQMPCKNVVAAAEMLISHQIAYGKLYFINANGTMEEMQV